MTKRQGKTVEEKKVERQFYNYERNRALAAYYISDKILEEMGVDYSKDRVKTSRANGVEKKVIMTIDEAERLHKWCLVYEKTKEHFKFSEKEKAKEKLMEMRYEDRNHKVCISDVIGASERTLDYWVRSVLSVGVEYARSFDLI